VFCEVAAVFERGFEVSVSFCWFEVDLAIVVMREVRRWRVDGRGFGDGVAIEIYLSPVLFSRFSVRDVEVSLSVFLVESVGVGVLCRESLLDLSCVWACARVVK
jgi:hypothetical protein